MQNLRFQLTFNRLVLLFKLSSRPITKLWVNFINFTKMDEEIIYLPVDTVSPSELDGMPK